MNFPQNLSRISAKGVLVALLGGLMPAGAVVAASTFSYLGDRIPSAGIYADWFTTLGPGHPTNSYFVGTDWTSDGNVLTMTTQNPNDGGGLLGHTSLGIWFGLTNAFGNAYGDPSGLNFSNPSTGDEVDARIALAPNSSEWSLLWSNGNPFNARGAQFYFLNNGFFYYTANGPVFVARNDMTSFHTYSSFLQGNQVSYFFDGALLASDTAYSTSGYPNYLFIGDTSASTVTGYGSMLIDRMDITFDTGEASPPPSSEVPEAGSTLLLLAASFGCLAAARHRRNRD